MIWLDSLNEHYLILVNCRTIRLTWISNNGNEISSEDALMVGLIYYFTRNFKRSSRFFYGSVEDQIETCSHGICEWIELIHALRNSTCLKFWSYWDSCTAVQIISLEVIVIGAFESTMIGNWTILQFSCEMENTAFQWMDHLDHHLAMNNMV